MHGLDVGEPRGGEVERGRRRRRRPRARAPSASAHDHAGVAVVDARGRSRWRSPAAAGRRTTPPQIGSPVSLGEPALDRAVPVAYAVRALAVGAEQPVLVERRQRAAAASPARPRRGTASAAGGASRARSAAAGVGRRSTSSTCVAARRRAAPSAASASPSRSASASSPISRAEAVRSCAARRPARRARASKPRDQVGEHRAGLDRGELVGVADQDQPGVGPHRLEQPGHHRQRDHRGLVDDDDVVRAAGCRGRGGSGCGCPGRQPSSRCRVIAVDARPSRARSAVGRARPSSSSTASCSRAAALPVGAVSAIRSVGRRRSACSASRASSPATVVVLPVPGPPVSTVVHWRGGRAAAARCSSYPSPGRPGRARPSSARRRRRAARAGRRGRPGRRGPGPPRASSGRGRAAPSLRAAAPPRPRPAGWRATAASQPPAPATAGRGRRAGRRPVARSTQTEPCADRPHGEGRRRAATVSSASPPASPSRWRDVDVGGLEHAGRVEGRAAARSAPSASRAVVRVARRLEQASRHAVTAVPSSRSESASTSAAGGCQAKTPHGWPSTTRASSGPHMPRR